MTKLLLISPSYERSKVEQILQPLDHYQLTCTDMGHIHKVLQDDPDHDVIIFDCLALHKQQLEFLQRISNLSENAKIIILAEQISIYSYQRVDEMDNMVTLQKPYDRSVLIALIDRVVSHSNIKPQRCPRFITNEPVRMVVMKTGLLIPTRMRNYSSTGAFLEYRGISLKVGDQIQISLEDRYQTDSERLQMQAKVIWIKEGEHNRSPMRGVGVKFLDL